MERKVLNKDELTLVAGLMPQTRQIASDLILAGQEYDEIICKIYELNGVEETIRKHLLQRLAHFHFSDFAAELYDDLHSHKKNATAENILNKYQKFQNMLDQTEHPRIANCSLSLFYLRKQLDKFYEMCLPYAEVFRIGREKIKKGGFISDLIKEAENVKRAGMLYDERRLFQVQAIKHGLSIFKLKGEITAHEMKQALQTNFSDDPEIFEKQISLIQKSYGTIKDQKKAREVKLVCYQFIRETINFWEFPSGTLVTYPLYGNVVTEETFNFYREQQDRLNQGGTAKAIFKELERLYKNINFNKEESLNPSEQRIVTLYKMFYQAKETPVQP